MQRCQKCDYPNPDNQSTCFKCGLSLLPSLATHSEDSDNGDDPIKSKFCTDCGSDITTASNFCPDCGAPTSKGRAPQGEPQGAGASATPNSHFLFSLTRYARSKWAICAIAATMVVVIAVSATIAVTRQHQATEMRAEVQKWKTLVKPQRIADDNAERVFSDHHFGSDDATVPEWQIEDDRLLDEGIEAGKKLAFYEKNLGKAWWRLISSYDRWGWRDDVKLEVFALTDYDFRNKDVVLERALELRRKIEKP